MDVDEITKATIAAYSRKLANNTPVSNALYGRLKKGAPVPRRRFWRKFSGRLRDAWAVLTGSAVADYGDY